MKQKTSLWLILTILVVVIMYFIWPLPFKYISRKVFVPLFEKTNVISRIIIRPIELFSSISQLENKNKQLEEENNLLKSAISKKEEEVVTCNNQVAERQRIVSQEYEYIQAKVIGRTPLSLNRQILISAGTDNGIDKDSTVIHQGYLIGKVVESYPETSLVKLVTSHDSLIPVITQDTRQTGLVRGGLQGLILTDLSAEVSVSDGEAVVTSGLGGDLDAGIPVGLIESNYDERGLFKEIPIEYPINPNMVEVVSVSKND